ncbi:MAG: hypothetical protein H8E98_02985 [Bacteroidetes bacterium]|nr:hypothetical protein [Bacteroidota bacterium]
MTKKLTPDELIVNYERLTKIAETYFSEDRMKKVSELLNFFEVRASTAPASGNINYHNCYAGGYCEHVLNVIDFALKIKENIWTDPKLDCTEEELVFSAFFHDFGKLGDRDNEYYLPEESQWHIDKMGRLYKINPNIPFMKVPDRTLFLLQDFGIKYTIKEFYGIKLSDGLYDESNKPYYINYGEMSIFTALPHVIHTADLMASKIEGSDIKKINTPKKPRIVKPKIEDIDIKNLKAFDNMFDIVEEE